MPRAQQSIQAFARIAKPHTSISASKKRKATPDIEDNVATTDHIKKRRVKDERTPIESPTRAMSRKLAGLELARLSPTPQRANKRVARSIASSPTTFNEAEDEEETPPTSPCPSSKEATDGALPRALEDFRALNTALLGALSLHYAHHGTASPMDIRHLAPGVTRIWGKRKVSTVDIERCLGVLERRDDVGASPTHTSSPFQLFDYGGGRTCIELVDFEGRARMGVHFDQDRLAAAFDTGLRRAWAAQATGEAGGDAEAAAMFVESLPRARVLPSPTAAKTAQSMALKRGQKRLEEVLGPREGAGEDGRQGKRRRVHTNGPAKAAPPTKDPEQHDTIKMKATPAPPPAAATSRAESLLDRIRAKQLHAASLPAAPTPEQLARAAALHRTTEVMSILDLLVAARGQGARASFPRRSLAESVRASLRSPMAREEVERCIDLIASEVAPGYVKVLNVGSVSGVVVETGMRPRAEELKARLAAAGI